MDIIEFVASIGMEAVICFILGLVLIIFEMFNPGFGFPGLAGLALLILSVVITADTVFEALVMITAILFIVGIATIIVLRSASRGRLSKKLVLSNSLNRQSGYSGTADFKHFLGKEGIAKSVLRPAGTAEFDGVKLDVVSESEFIDNGAGVKVVEVSGSRVVVREISS